MVDSLKEIYLNYIKKPCSKEENYSWVECSLFCLPFKICQQNKTATFYLCTCEPFLCKEKCANPDHQRIPYCYNCKINEECNNIKGYHLHCTTYDCKACAFDDNLEEICEKLIKGGDDIVQISYTLNKFLLFIIVTKVLVNLIKKNYDPFYDPLNYELPGVAFCKCWGSWQCKCCFKVYHFILEPGY